MSRPLSMLVSILKKAGEKAAPVAARSNDPSAVRPTPRDPRSTKNA